MAAAVRRGDEDDPMDKRQGFVVEAAPEQFARFGRDVELIDGNVEKALPETLAAVDGGQLREQPALAVADDHHLPQGAILARGVELLNHAAQALREDPAG